MLAGNAPKDDVAAQSVVHIGKSNILPFGGPQCSGTLIDPEWVITAGHCQTKVGTPISVGVSKSAPAARAKVASTIDFFDSVPNPQSEDHVYGTYDSMLLKLDRPVTEVSPATIYQGDELAEEGTETVAYGWGASLGGIPFPSDKTLDKQTGKIVKTENTIIGGKYFYKSSVNKLDGKSKIVQGDSGGPLFIDGNYYASVSGGRVTKEAILDSTRTSYVPIINIKTWIRDNTGIVLDEARNTAISYLRALGDKPTGEQINDVATRIRNGEITKYDITTALNQSTNTTPRDPNAKEKPGGGSSLGSSLGIFGSSANTAIEDSNTHSSSNTNSSSTIDTTLSPKEEQSISRPNRETIVEDLGLNKDQITKVKDFMDNNPQASDEDILGFVSSLISDTDSITSTTDTSKKSTIPSTSSNGKDENDNTQEPTTTKSKSPESSTSTGKGKLHSLQDYKDGNVPTHSYKEYLKQHGGDNTAKPSEKKESFLSKIKSFFTGNNDSDEKSNQVEKDTTNDKDHDSHTVGPVVSTGGSVE